MSLSWEICKGEIKRLWDLEKKSPGISSAEIGNPIIHITYDIKNIRETKSKIT
jgi:hypothetical protein